MAEALNAAETADAQAENQVEETSRHHPHEVVVIVHLHDDDGPRTQEFTVSRHATLLEMMKEAVRLAGLALLPPGERPFDRLYLGDDTSTGPIDDLKKTVAEVVGDCVDHPHFLLELARTFRVNVRWAAATAKELTPREILVLPGINLNYEEFTLYSPDSDDKLPLDTPTCIKRGMEFEAQPDGKYGKGPAC